MIRFCICSLWSHLNVLTFSPLTGGCSEGLDAFRFFFKYNWLVQEKYHTYIYLTLHCPRNMLIVRWVIRVCTIGETKWFMGNWMISRISLQYVLHCQYIFRRKHVDVFKACVCVFIKLHITAQSGPVILVILCHSHWSSQGGINDTCYENLWSDATKGTMYVCVCVFMKLHITAQSGPVILVILCNSHWSCVSVLHVNRSGF